MNYDLSWMLDSALEVPAAQHALLVSADGLLMARSKDVGKDQADTIAAAMSGIQSLSRTVVDFCGTPASRHRQWRQTLVEFDHGWVFLISAGEGAYLAVSATPDVDMAEITFRMQQLVGQLGKALTTPPREIADTKA
ncbi:roadblock/LC7 domain-containing protein [Streptomyces sp. FT05W]|uniref:Roadblock/LC7 family protein n=2 Tax=Streptomyces TaxID=1883 RepID=A0A8D3WPC1_STRFA|nr:MULTISPECIES: roadblock/LC7 domain-containing protein [Streptomyces]MDF9874425.1 putative regulator of Ras-like GTPase activity (Roadblock/LC7/MglB family) [Streptomyces pratensis]MYT54966.1 roadblock/LC7 domain-containing protein [Streptomyces sp. SID7815]MYT59117.1 roadblock/LC7 domain-containing protein [Streptomyces sp. SID7834]RAS32603.1 putative regulator of Ras-like GTPase activity (Roadblock/LC7/MglB family) [Streptomyces avidinii]TPN26427.1 roadblock/LC7 domain-containing protein [